MSSTPTRARQRSHLTHSPRPDPHRRAAVWRHHSHRHRKPRHPFSFFFFFCPPVLTLTLFFFSFLFFSSESARVTVLQKLAVDDAPVACVSPRCKHTLGRLIRGARLVVGVGGCVSQRRTKKALVVCFIGKEKEERNLRPLSCSLQAICDFLM